MEKQIFILIKHKISNNAQNFFYTLDNSDLESLKNLGLELEIKKEGLLFLRDYNLKKIYFVILENNLNLHVNCKILNNYHYIYEIPWLTQFKIENTFDIYNLYIFFKNLSIDAIIDKNLYKDAENNICYFYKNNFFGNGVIAVDNYINNTVLKEKGVDSNEYSR